MLGHLDRHSAARYSAFALVPLVLGVLAAGWALRGGSADPDPRLDAIEKPAAPAPLPVKNDRPPAGGEAGPAAGASTSIAARFDAIKNRPIPVSAEPLGTEDPLPQTETPESLSDIKYVGPVRLGPMMMAILRVEGRQMTTSRGRTLSFTANEEHHTAKVLEVEENEITIEENGKERKIGRAESSGEVVSYLGGKPNRSGKPVAMKKPGGPKAGAGTNDPQARADYETKRARAMQELAPMIDKMAKSGNPAVAREMREKAIMKLKQDGLDAGLIDEALGQSKTNKGGEQ